MRNCTLIAILIYFFSGTVVWSKPYLRIQSVRSLEYPYIKTEVSVSKITPIRNLREENFSLIENGWQVSNVQVKKIHSEKDPKNLVLLIDSSLSLSKNIFNAQIKAVRELIGSLHKKDRVAIISFNDKSTVNCGFIPVGLDLNNCLNKIVQNGKKTVLYNAILTGYQMMESLKVARKSIIVFTDGKDEGSEIAHEDLLRRAEKTQIPIFLVGNGNRQKLKKIARLAKISGGKAFQALKVENVRKIYMLIHQLLENTYLIRYISQGSETSKDGRTINLVISISGEDEAGYPIKDQDMTTFYLDRPAIYNWKFWVDPRYQMFLIGFGVIILVLLILAFRPFRKIKVQLEQPIIPNSSRDFYIEKAPLFTSKQKAPFVQSQVQPQPKPKFMAYLFQKEGAETGKKYRIYWEKITIGAALENTIVLSDPHVSMKHAQIQKKNEHYFLLDLVSKGGTFLNGKKLLRPKELNDFDEIQVGYTKLVFRKASGYETVRS